MKKINVLMLGVLVLFAGFFASCKKDTTGTGPDISFTNGIDNTSVASGGSWTVTGLITSDAGLDQVKYFKTVGGSETQIGAAITSFNDKNNFDFTVTVSNVTATTTVRIEATDKDNITNSLVYTINVGSSVAKLNFWTGTLAAQLGAQGNTTVGSSYATSTNLVYLAPAASTNSASVDFYYFYGDAGILAEILSPFYAGGTGNISSVAGWATKNATKFGTSTLTSSQFDGIIETDDSPVITAATSLTADRITTLAQGTVFAFQTAAGKKGVAKVTSISGTTAGTITIEVKVQK